MTESETRTLWDARWGVEMAGSGYHPQWGPRPKRNAHPVGCALGSGDGGNRTRVRKTRPTEIYERSRLGMSPQVTQPAKLTCSHLLGPESPLSRSKQHRARHCPFLTPNPFTGGSTGRVDAASSKETGCSAQRLCSEGHGSIGSAIGT